MEENTQENVVAGADSALKNNGQNQIVGAILVAGIIIAGAILLKGDGVSTAPVPITGTGNVASVALDPVGPEDYVLGNSRAKVVVIEYSDFQCPFCKRFFTDTEPVIRENYVDTGKVKFVYRDFAFLGPESLKAAEAARCAGDQNKFWEYHDYLFTHQGGENQGNFSNPNLKSFALALDLNASSFNQCLETGKYTKKVAEAVAAGQKAGVRGTPKGFILRDGKIVATIDGAEPTPTITAKIDAALK